MARGKHCNYSDDDFKAMAVGLTEVPGVLAKDVAEAFDAHEVMLYLWRMEMRRGQIMAEKNIDVDPEVKSELKRLRKLEREHSLLQEEHALSRSHLILSATRG